MRSDRILVLDAGCVAEFDTPSELVKHPGGHLRRLIDETGVESAANLIRLARMGPVGKDSK